MRSEPSCARIVFLSPMCTQRPISISASSGGTHFNEAAVRKRA
jgi:hypothetical protein